MKKHYSSIISNAFGKFASKPFPKPVQRIINSSYVKLMKLDMSEFKEPREYETLNRLFTRKLNSPREIERDEKVMISPVDALVTDFGEIVDGKAYQIKGMEYDISKLFGENHQESARFLDGGQFVNLYLSPKDYHRYHMPHKLRVESMTHIAGKLYPVNFPLLRNKKELFIENERVIIDCEDIDGNTYIIVLVGALNVGKMVVIFEDSISTNSDLRESKHYTYDDLWLEKGELFGWFEMGSTILLFSEKDTFMPKLEINQKVKFAEPIGKIQ
jgi:phosphatidylserine decarboxylase